MVSAFKLLLLINFSTSVKDKPVTQKKNGQNSVLVLEKLKFKSKLEI